MCISVAVFATLIEYNLVFSKRNEVIFYEF